MKAALTTLGALLGLALTGSTASAFYPTYGYPYYGHPCVPPAPDACGPGYYCANHCGVLHPAWNLRPPFPPHNGLIFPPPGYGGNGAGMGGMGGNGMMPSGVFANHPFARSPRDFFMVDVVK